jgi:RNA polymerase sigma factor (TIGR02999 family)
MRRGDASAADLLLPLVYDELRDVARRYLQAERGNHTLQATALVHEAYLRLVDQKKTDWRDRAHFIAIAATMIRRTLIDHSRRHSAEKRGSGEPALSLADAGLDLAAAADTGVDLLALDHALTELTRLDERQARVVELRFFGGLSVDESAEVLGVSPRTVDGDWRVARAWLKLKLEGSAS